ncbi:MAG: putative transporter substrate binding protein [Bryobacterales bacterium]|nr:putative transporter substrate binding protein [Bryobacterales bacterium]
MRLGIVLALALLTACGGGRTREVRIPKGAGGLGFLPLLVMEKYRLIEKHAAESGVGDVTVRWMDLGGPAAMNDALLSSSADFISAGPPAFLTLWDKTHGPANSVNVEGVAAMTSMPMYLNTRAEHLKKLDDITDQDKIAVTSIKVSIPAIIMQMYAKEKYGPAQATRFDKFTVSMAHPDAVVALLSGAAGISAHFSSPPFHQRERKDPHIRTILTSDDVMGGSTTFTMISTTSKFRQENPQIYAAVLKALEEAQRMIVADKKMAADILVTSEGGGLTRDEIVEVLNDPHVKFTTTPENLMKYAEFMYGAGSIKNRPGSWKDLFFPEIHNAPGS